VDREVPRVYPVPARVSARELKTTLCPSYWIIGKKLCIVVCLVPSIAWSCSDDLASRSHRLRVEEDPVMRC
jgi:hypothetical protein